MDLYTLPLKTLDSSEPTPLSAAQRQELLEASLLTAEQCASIGQVSVSWWSRESLAGRAPAPAVRKRKFARWRFVDVLEFWKNIHTYEIG